MKRQRQAGSMLIEVAASVTVLGLLAATSFGIFRDVDVARQGRAATALVNRARLLTLEFTLAHGRLPCPDLTGAGVEGDAAGNCPAGRSYGFLPTISLGMDGVSAQAPQRQLRYGVFRMTPDADLAASAPAGDADRPSAAATAR